MLALTGAVMHAIAMNQYETQTPAPDGNQHLFISSPQPASYGDFLYHANDSRCVILNAKVAKRHLLPY